MASGHQSAPQDPAAADLIALEERFGQAIVKADLMALGQLVSDDWIIVGPEGGLVDKQAFLDIVGSGALTHSRMDADEVRVRIYEDTAIVTGRTVAEGTYQGRAFTTCERASDVFVRQQGRWRCVLTHLTTIVPAK